MLTYATLKQMVANRLGKTDNATANLLRDNAIVDACRQIYQDADFSWLHVRGTLTVTLGVATLPANWSVSFGIIKAFSAVSGTANDHPYTRVDPLDFDAYQTDGPDYVYTTEYDTTTHSFVFRSNHTSDTVTIIYQVVPDDLVNDNDVTPIPDASCIRDLAVSLWWLAAERDETNADRFYQRYVDRLKLMISLDRTHATPRRALRSQFQINDQDILNNELRSVRR